MSLTTPTPAAGRAGRNLTAAVGVGVGLAAVILLSLFIVRAAFLGVVTAAVLIGIVELASALRTRSIELPIIVVGAGGLAMLLGAWFGGAEALVVAFFLTAFAVLGVRVVDGPAGYLRDATAGVLAAAWVPLLAGFAVLMLVPDDGARRVVTLVIVTACSDIGGYASGVLLGRHPMAPSISPKKSWEGFAGSVLLCAAGGGACVALLLDGPVWAGVLLGLAVVVTATLGDLGESMVKRDLGIKDMGRLLPGHGGIMDRLDSLLPTAPVVYLLLLLFVPGSG